MPTVTWTTETWPDGTTAEFPGVDIAPGVIWKAHHSCSPTTDWLDGHLVTANSDTVLDIVAIEGDDGAFELDWVGPELHALRARAREAWDKGEVIFIEEGALIVPFADLTEGDIIAEAIARFRP